MLKRILLIISLSFPFSVQANEDVYGFIEYGESSVNTGVVATTAKLDEDDTFKGYFLGKKILKNTAIEIGYLDFGKATLSGNSGDQFIYDGTTYEFVVNNVNYTAKADSFALGAKHFLKMSDNFSGFIKGGIHSYDGKLTASADSISDLTVGTDKSEEIYYGFGLSYEKENMFIALGFSKYEVDSNTAVIDTVEVKSISFGYKF